MKDIETTLRLSCQLQSVIHTIDELSESVQFKRQLKQRTNSYSMVIDKFLNELQECMDIDEVENYSLIVNEIDKIVEKIKL